ncbi:tetratricopeptide repeat-containing sensor histidine kinase [Planktosalinus lacus]|uniref:histidine kinase n=1 Tax=Planktosalinus lacus TaxID=1526573 RepID=A0A8J2VEH0_9FLAO|nr:tetratricopeptide repeat-containing sensor histidine kinase [Planktosalinus lacus]GGE00498.1 hypothetical protein GCM10011312_24960 [Planktosalinus lacus]
MLNQLLTCIGFLFVAFQAAFAQVPDGEIVDSSEIYYQRVLNPTATHHLPTGYFYYLKHKESHLISGDTLNAIDVMRMAAIAGFKLGSYNESEQLAVEALELLQNSEIEQSQRQARRVGLYNHLGKIYREKELYSKALDYYNLALEEVDKVSDRITLLNNRANVFIELDRHQQATTDFQKAIQLGEQSGDTLRWARALNNLGVLKVTNYNREGLRELQRALDLRIAIGETEGMYSSYRHLALNALRESDTAAATRYANRSLELAEELNSATFLMESLSILTELKKDPTVVRYKDLTDSLNSAQQEEQNLFAAMRFDVDKEILNTQRARAQMEKERSQKQLTQIIALLLLILLGLVIFIILNRVKLVKQREIYKTENRISKKVHDEVANEVYQVMVKMQLKEADSGNELLDNLESIYNRSRDISKEYSALNDALPFDEVITDLLAGYQSDGLTIVKRFSKNVDWSQISQHKKNALYRVLQELMTNMKKHSKATLVAVSMNQKGTKTELFYSDNGVGSTLKKQNGLQNVENRIFALNGSITFETAQGKGFKVKISV